MTGRGCSGIFALFAFVAVHRPVLAAPNEDPAAVLGLDGTADGTTLTDALRRAFAKHGLSGPTMDWVELRLGLGCEEDDFACLARGGKELGARRLVFGTLDANDDGYALELIMLEVEASDVSMRLSTTLTPDALRPESIDATAERVVQQMLPSDSAPIVPVTTVSSTSNAMPPPPPPSSADTHDGSRSALVWGPYRPRPAWKWAGLGTSAALTVAFAGAAIGLRMRLPGLESDLRKAADESLTDDNPANDVNRDLVSDLCGAARHPNPTSSEPNAVTNARITKLCNQADGILVAHWATAGVAIVAGVSTAIFTTLLFVHRPSPARARRTRSARWAVAPQLDGFALTIAGQF
jgi:hypothetical protein